MAEQGRADQDRAREADQSASIERLMRERDAAEAALAEQAGTGYHLRNLLAVIHRDGGHYTQEHGLQKAVEDAYEVVGADRVKVEEQAAVLARVQPIADAALAWERARQAIWQPGQFVETHPAEMSERMHAHSQREKELRALCHAALATEGAAPGGQGGHGG